MDPCRRPDHNPPSPKPGAPQPRGGRGRAPRSAAVASWWAAVLGLSALNAWWWWDDRPLPKLRWIERWIGVEREAGTRPVAWWDIGDVSRDNDGAVSVLRRAVRHSPHDGEARLLLGRALAARKDFRGCAEQLRMVPAWSPRKPEALYFEAMSWLELKRARDGEAALRAYLDVDPNHPWPRPRRVEVENKLLDIYAWEDRWDESRAVIWKAYEDSPGLPLARRKLLETSLRTRLERSHPVAALANLRDLVNADPGDWEARRALARMADEEKLPGESDAHLSRCLAERPEDPRAWVDRLEILEARREYDALDSALASLPKVAEADGRAWMVRGRAARSAKDFRGAAEAFARAVEKLPYDPNAHYNLALVLQRLERSAEAEPHRRLHAKLLKATAEVPEAVNAYKDAVDVTAPRRDAVKAAMKRLAAACLAMGWKRDAEGWSKLADET